MKSLDLNFIRIEDLTRFDSFDSIKLPSIRVQNARISGVVLGARGGPCDYGAEVCSFQPCRLPRRWRSCCEEVQEKNQKAEE
jgi:hypothetical protein